jgi:hypothetical protein
LIVPRKKKQEGVEVDAADTPSRRATTEKVKKPTSKKSGGKARKVTTAPKIAPSDDEIRIRAYFISERRRRFDLPGDADSDWLEAKRQLLSETRH